MKRYLSIFLLVLSLTIPALTVEAAYVSVPNFYNMASNKFQLRIKFNGMDQLSYNGVNYTRWYYQCMDGNEYKYINKYLNRINNKHNMTLVGQDSNNWYFIYTGAQAKYLNMLDGSFHIHVGANGNSVVVDLVAGMYPAP